MNTSTEVSGKSGCEEYDERQKRTVKKIVEVLGNPKYLHHVVQGGWDRITVIRHEGTKPAKSVSFSTLGRGGLISVEHAKVIARMVSGAQDPDPKAMRILTEYLEDEWATFRLADVNREVDRYDAANRNGAYIPRCQSCGHQSNTSVCVPCRKALAMTLANLDVALALFVKEEVSIFRVEDTGPAITVGDAFHRMYQGVGYLTREHVKALCKRAAIVPYDDNGKSAAGMMQDYLNAGTRKAVAIRDETRKDMMSFGFDDKTEDAICEAADGKWCLSVQSQPHIFWNGSSIDQKAPLLSTAFLGQGEASWPHCIDKDGNVSGDLLDMLYEFYERLREKHEKDKWPSIPRKSFVALLSSMFMFLGDSGPNIIKFPWGKSTKASTLSAIEFGMDNALKTGDEDSVEDYAMVLSVFQDMFSPKDDSALWGSSCD